MKKFNRAPTPQKQSDVILRDEKEPLQIMYRQLVLLSERSKTASLGELPKLTEAMCSIIRCLYKDL